MKANGTRLSARRTKEDASALYLRLQSDLEKSIRDGKFALGSKLPPERQLALKLRISRTTVTNAYRELEAKGLVRGYVGRGTYVCALPEPADVPFAWRGKMSATSLRLSATQSAAVSREAVNPKLISFSLGCPALEVFPTEDFQQISRSILAHRPAQAIGLGAVSGQPALREAIAKQHDVAPEQVMIVAGSQEGVDLLARCLIDPGDHVIVETPGYFIAFQSFQAAGARLVGWDARRADMDQLENLILRYHPKFVCTTATFQNPTSRTLSLSQRKDLIDLVTRYRVPLIDDEPYRELYFDSPPPQTLHALDKHGVVIHLGTFSKMLAPGLRLGYVVAPENVIELLAIAKHRAASFTPGLEQLVLAEMIGSGLLPSHLARLRQEHRIRRDTMVEALGQAFPKSQMNFAVPAGGLYLWCRIGMGVNSSTLNDVAMQHGVVFTPGNFFHPDAGGEDQLRLCFAGSSPAKVREGVARLKNAFAKASAKNPAQAAARA